MLLGAIIANLADETSVLETLASLDDLVLLARMREAAAASGEPLGSFASAAVGSFVARADDAAWLSLMAVTSKADDPGKACSDTSSGPRFRRRSHPVPVTTDASPFWNAHRACPRRPNACALTAARRF